MTDPRVARLARLLTEYSARIQPGDRVLIEAEIQAEPLARELYRTILEAGGHPYLMASFGGQAVGYSGLDDVFFSYASPEQLKAPNPFFEHAYSQFESRIRIHSLANTKMLTNVDPAKMKIRRTAMSTILKYQVERGAADEFKWVTTQFPTAAYAQEAEMSLPEYEDFLYTACHVSEDVADPVEKWEAVRTEQNRIIEQLKGGELIHVRSPHCDFQVSVAGRKFLNAAGLHNMPDGEIFTGPVEDSAQGWVEFTYPTAAAGRMVSGARLEFEAGRVVEASAERGQDHLLSALDTDEGARYLGEFAIGLNEGIQRHTRNILLDEKIGGSFHMALGAGYPETGSVNKSAIHWDLICDLHHDSEITLDGEVVYRNGKFIV